MEILPSLASSDFMEIGRTLDCFANWPILHVDIEDGNFTPNITFGLKLLGQAIQRAPKVMMDVHLMTTRPMEFLDSLEALGIVRVCAHLEALPFPLLFLNAVRSGGMKAGLAINLKTPLTLLEPFVERMDYLLVMTAEPDGEGERLNPVALEKACQAVATLPIPVYVDGALDELALERLAAAGAAGCVLGRMIFSEQEPLRNAQQLAHRFNHNRREE